MSTTNLCLSVFLTFLFALGGCAEEKKASVAECDRESCSQRCRDLAGPDCDVRKASCQKRIFEAVSCVRGAGGKRPPIRTLTEDEVRAENAQDGAVDGGTDGGVENDGGVSEADGPMEPAFHWDVALRLLGLRVPQSSTDSTDYAGGYYESVHKRITLIDRGQPQDSVSAQKLLAHELVHALQDQHMGFAEVWRSSGTSTDARLAHGCLTEGEGDLYEELAWSLLRDLPIDRTYLDVNLTHHLKESRDGVLRADSPYDQLWLLRYAVGHRYLFDAWLEGGNWAVQSLYEGPPQSTIYWMHGFAASQTRREPLTRPLACHVAALPKGYERQWSDTMGAFTLFAFLGHNLVKGGVYPTEVSWRRAMAWSQDHLEVFAGPEGETAVSWRVRFAEADTASEVADELRANKQLDLHVKQHGAEIELFSSDSKQAMQAFRGTDPKRCPIED